MPLSYQTKQQQVAISGVADLTIRSLLDRQQYFDPDGIAESLGISSAAWPMFGLLWPSGVQLAAQMVQRPVRASERVLEVGCGLALASLVSHRRGVNITASDCHPLTAKFLAENLRLNGLEPMKYRYGHWAETAETSSVDDCATASVTGRFDLIIGSDVLYERDRHHSLTTFINRHAAANGEVWIVDPDRGNRTAFNRQMALHGFAQHEQRLDCAESQNTAAYKGRLLTYSRRSQHA